MGTFAKSYQSSINRVFQSQLYRWRKHSGINHAVENRVLKNRAPINRALISRAAFTLVEMLCVMGIMLTMLAMVVPALNDVLGSKGRKGAVSILLNTFEQARVAALEQSTDVYVGFADGGIPGQEAKTKDFPYTRFIVFRNSIAEIDGATAPRYIALTKWQSLPKGISFKSGTGLLNGSGATPTAHKLPIAPVDKFPSITSDYSMPVLQFSNTGIIRQPTSRLELYIYEGFWGGSGTTDVFTRRRGQSDTDGTSLYERIKFARYTGRAELDITVIPPNS